MDTQVDLFEIMRKFGAADKSSHLIYNELNSTLSVMNHPVRSNSTALILCSSGYMDMEIDFKTYRLTEYWSINLMKEHIVQIKEISDDFSGVCLIMDQHQWRESRREVEQLAPLYSTTKAQPFVPLKSDQKELLMTYIQLFKAKYYDPDLTHNTIIKRKLISILFYEVDRIYANIRSEVPEYDRKDKIVMEFLNLVSTHFRVERRVKFYADYFQITPKYLSAIIGQRSHQSAAQWIDSYVVTEAKILLRTTTKSIKEIADELNFSDQSFFGKYFLLHTGMRPSVYRKK